MSEQKYDYKFSKRVKDPTKEFELLGTLGKGSFGAVYWARERVSGLEIAIKKLRVVQESDLQVAVSFFLLLLLLLLFCVFHFYFLIFSFIRLSFLFLLLPFLLRLSSSSFLLFLFVCCGMFVHV